LEAKTRCSLLFNKTIKHLIDYGYFTEKEIITIVSEYENVEAIKIRMDRHSTT